MARLLVLPLVALLAACGGGGSGGGGATPDPSGGGADGGGTTDGAGGSDPGGGTVGGGDGGQPNGPASGTAPLAVTSASTPLTPQDVLGAVATNVACTRNGAGAYYSAIRVVATSWAATCEGLRSNKANSTTLDLLVSRARTNGQAPDPIAPGEYPVGGSGDATAQIRVARKDARCGPGPDPGASEGWGVSGTVTVRSVSPRLEGSVDATLGNGARVTGSFSAAACVVSPGDACDVATLDPTSLGACVQ
jgi:hypothetical protein